jgi:hypothetical protein
MVNSSHPQSLELAANQRRKRLNVNGFDGLLWISALPLAVAQTLEFFKNVLSGVALRR